MMVSDVQIFNTQINNPITHQYSCHAIIRPSTDPRIALRVSSPMTHSHTHIHPIVINLKEVLYFFFTVVNVGKCMNRVN